MLQNNEVRRLASAFFVDSNHVGDKVSHRSRSDFLIFMNTSLVQWFSKKSSKVEDSVFGAVCGHEVGHRCSKRLKA